MSHTVLISAVRIFEISNRIVTSVFDLKRVQLFEIFEYLPSPISYLFNRMTPILADRTNGRAIGTVLRLSVAVCNVKYCG